MLLHILVSWIVSALALWIVAQIIPGIQVRGFGAATRNSTPVRISWHITCKPWVWGPKCRWRFAWSAVWRWWSRGRSRRLRRGWRDRSGGSTVRCLERICSGTGPGQRRRRWWLG